MQELKWICSEDADLQVFVSHAARWLRVACPDECGCTDPLATPLLKPPFHGCREACIQEAYGFSFQSTSPLYGNVPNFTLGCKDAPPGPGWRHFWDHYLAYISYETNFDYSTIQSLVDWVAYARDAGCVALQWLPLDMQGNMWCRGGEKYRSLAWFCPETCGCAVSGNTETGSLLKSVLLFLCIYGYIRTNRIILNAIPIMVQERDHFCYAYDHCPMHVLPNETDAFWLLVRKYDLLKPLLNPQLLSVRF